MIPYISLPFLLLVLYWALLAVSLILVLERRVVSAQIVVIVAGVVMIVRSTWMPQSLPFAIVSLIVAVACAVAIMVLRRRDSDREREEGQADADLAAGRYREFANAEQAIGWIFYKKVKTRPAPNSDG